MLPPPSKTLRSDVVDLCLLSEDTCTYRSLTVCGMVPYCTVPYRYRYGTVPVPVQYFTSLHARAIPNHTVLEVRRIKLNSIQPRWSKKITDTAALEVRSTEPVPYGTVPVPYRTLPFGKMLTSTVRYGTVRYSNVTVRYSTVPNRTVLYRTVWYCTVYSVPAYLVRYRTASQYMFRGSSPVF